MGARQSMHMPAGPNSQLHFRQHNSCHPTYYEWPMLGWMATTFIIPKWPETPKWFRVKFSAWVVIISHHLEPNEWGTMDEWMGLCIHKIPQANVSGQAKPLSDVSQYTKDSPTTSAPLVSHPYCLQPSSFPDEEVLTLSPHCTGQSHSLYLKLVSFYHRKVI